MKYFKSKLKENENIIYKIFGLLLFSWSILVTFGLGAHLVMNASFLSESVISAVGISIAISAFLTGAGMIFYTQRSENRKTLAVIIGMLSVAFSAAMLLFTYLADNSFIVYAIVSFAMSIVIFIGVAKRKN